MIIGIICNQLKFILLTKIQISSKFKDKKKPDNRFRIVRFRNALKTIKLYKYFSLLQAINFILHPEELPKTARFT